MKNRDLDGSLQEMLDHHEIRQVLSIYCHGCDRCDAGLMGSIYAGEDSFDDHGHMRATGQAFADMMTRQIAETTKAVSHVLGQSLIKASGSTAVAETAFIAMVRIPNPDGIDRLNQMAGRYVDELVRTDGMWRVKYRTAILDVSITLKIEEDANALHGMANGRRDKTDLGVAALGIAHIASHHQKQF